MFSSAGLYTTLVEHYIGMREEIVKLFGILLHIVSTVPLTFSGWIWVFVVLPSF